MLRGLQIANLETFHVDIQHKPFLSPSLFRLYDRLESVLQYFKLPLHIDIILCIEMLQCH